MNHIAAKIEGLATFGDDIVILVGPDLMPVDFVRAGPELWIGDCTTEGCRGLIETDSPEFAAAICPACEDRLDEQAELEALQAPRAPGVLAMVPPEEGQRSLVSVAPKLEIVAPARPLPQFGHQRCKHCERYLTIDNSSGQMDKLCGTCRAEGKPAPVERHCLTGGCDSDMSGYDKSKLFCNDCNRARGITGQRRATKTSRANRSAKVKLCHTCHCPIENAHHASKYCPEHQVEMRNKHRRENMAKKRAREKTESTQQGDTHAES